MQRQFFSGNSVDQAVMTAARHFGIEPERLSYKLRDKKTGFLNARRRVVIEVDPQTPSLTEDEIQNRAKAARPAEERRPAPVERPAPSRQEIEEEEESFPVSYAGGHGHADDDEEDGQAVFGLGVGAEAERAPARAANGRADGGRADGGRADGARPDSGRPDSGRADSGRAPRPEAPRSDRGGERGGDRGKGRGERSGNEARDSRGGRGERGGRTSPERGGRGGQDRGSRGPDRDRGGRGRRGGAGQDRRGRGGAPERGGAGRRTGRGDEKPRRELVKVVEHHWKDGEWRELLSEEGDNVSREVLAFEKAIELILDVMDLDIEFSVSEGEVYLVEFSGEDRDRLVAEEGRALKAIEHILPRIVRGMVGEALPCRVDCEDFQASREQELVELAKKTAEEVGRSNKPRLLPPMNPADRRIIHVTLMEDPDVDTLSEGDGFIKRIKIFPVRH